MVGLLPFRGLGLRLYSVLQFVLLVVLGLRLKLLWRRVVFGMPTGTGPPVAVRSLPLVLGRLW